MEKRRHIVGICKVSSFEKDKAGKRKMRQFVCRILGIYKRGFFFHQIALTQTMILLPFSAQQQWPLGGAGDAAAAIALIFCSRNKNKHHKHIKVPDRSGNHHFATHKKGDLLQRDTYKSTHTHRESQIT